MPTITAPATVAIRPVPGAEIVRDIRTSPALTEWLTDAPPGTPVHVTVDGWLRRRESGASIPIIIEGSVFDGVIYGESARIHADAIVLRAMGVTPPREGLYADLAVVTEIDLSIEPETAE